MSPTRQRQRPTGVGTVVVVLSIKCQWPVVSGGDNSQPGGGGAEGAHPEEMEAGGKIQRSNERKGEREWRQRVSVAEVRGKVHRRSGGDAEGWSLEDKTGETRREVTQHRWIENSTVNTPGSNRHEKTPKCMFTHMIMVECHAFYQHIALSL